MTSFFIYDLLHLTRVDFIINIKINIISRITKASWGGGQLPAHPISWDAQREASVKETWSSLHILKCAKPHSIQWIQITSVWTFSRTSLGGSFKNCCFPTCWLWCEQEASMCGDNSAEGGAGLETCPVSQAAGVASHPQCLWVAPKKLAFGTLGLRCKSCPPLFPWLIWGVLVPFLLLAAQEVEQEGIWFASAPSKIAVDCFLGQLFCLKSAWMKQ